MNNRIVLYSNKVNLFKFFLCIYQIYFYRIKDLVLIGICMKFIQIAIYLLILFYDMYLFLFLLLYSDQIVQFEYMFNDVYIVLFFQGK